MVNFWVRKGNTLEAPLTLLVEDVLEDSPFEIQEETSLHVEDENRSNDREEKVGEKEEEIAEKEKKVTISEERLDITNDALSNEFLRQEEKEKEDVEKVYGLFKSTKKDQTSTNAKKMRRSVPSNLSTEVPSIKSSPRRRSQLVTSASPAPVVKERSLFKVEARLTRLQEKVEMEVLMEERRKVPQFALLNSNISRRARGVKRSIKSEGLEKRRRM